MTTTSQPNIIKASIDIEIDIAELWSLLINKEMISGITGLAVRSDITDKSGSGNGVVTIGSGVFFARYSPYEAELNGTQAKLKLRAVQTGFGCRIAIAASLPKNTMLKLSSERLQGFLNNLKTTCDDSTSAKNPVYEAFSQQNEPDPEEPVDTASAEESSLPVPTTRTQRAQIFTAEPERKESKTKRVPKPRKAPKRRWGLRLAMVFTLFFAMFSLMWLIFSHFRGMENSTDASDRVSLESAKEIKLGMSKNQIAFHLKTNGVTTEKDRVIYRSITAPGNRRPQGMISVSYNAGGRADSVSYLDCEASVSIYGIKDFTANVTPDMTIEEVASELGLPFSLYRRYNADDGSEMEEVHFGYLDPTANFNPAWRGEFEVIFNRTNKSVSIKNWGWYDGSDPTMIGSIENTPFANQYDDYTDFLNDRFQFSRSRLLLNGYSLGDTKYFFDGEPVHYSNDFGYQFFSVDSKERVGNSDSPLYRISIGYDNKGTFQMASFSNMRLYNKTGTLIDSDYRLITRGMTYGEVRSLMRLVPTAMYIDSDYFSVCYGRFLNTDVADEQFEVIVRFDHETYHAQRVLINAAVSGVVDAENTGDG